MKKLIFALSFVFVFAFSTQASTPFTEFKAGYHKPKDANAGYLFGLNLGRMIDESLSWSFEFNYFQKGYREETTVIDEEPQAGIDPKTKQLELEFTTRIIPMLAKLNYEHPIAYRSPFYIRGSAGIGWQMVWNEEDNYEYEDPIHETRFFHGFGWQVAAGIGLEISSSANFFVDGFYNGSTVKRNQTENKFGLPVWEELNISGFGLKLGVSIVGFGW